MLLLVIFILMLDFREKANANNKAIIETLTGQRSNGMVIESFVRLFLCLNF